MSPPAGPGAVGGERSEPPSASASRPRTAQPSLGCEAQRASEPVKPRQPERRRPSRRQFNSGHVWRRFLKGLSLQYQALGRDVKEMGLGKIERDLNSLT